MLIPVYSAYYRYAILGLCLLIVLCSYAYHIPYLAILCLLSVCHILLFLLSTTDIRYAILCLLFHTMPTIPYYAILSAMPTILTIPTIPYYAYYSVLCHTISYACYSILCHTISYAYYSYYTYYSILCLLFHTIPAMSDYAFQMCTPVVFGAKNLGFFKIYGVSAWTKGLIQ